MQIMSSKIDLDTFIIKIEISIHISVTHLS